MQRYPRLQPKERRKQTFYKERTKHQRRAIEDAAATYTLSVIRALAIVIVHLWRTDHVCGFSGSFGPSQVTKFGSGAGKSGSDVGIGLGVGIVGVDPEDLGRVGWMSSPPFELAILASRIIFSSRGEFNGLVCSSSIAGSVKVSDEWASSPLAPSHGRWNDMTAT